MQPARQALLVLAAIVPWLFVRRGRRRPRRPLGRPAGRTAMALDQADDGLVHRLPGQGRQGLLGAARRADKNHFRARWSLFMVKISVMVSAEVTETLILGQSIIRRINNTRLCSGRTALAISLVPNRHSFLLSFHSPGGL